MKHRIEYLDGHRGIAILLVVFYHAYARWPELVPYGNAYGNFPLFKYGWLGVELFFLISGFVILMTLEKYAGGGEFIFRRWLRLFPAMLFCSILIFVTAGFFDERPDGIPSPASLLPGLTFIEPSWWQAVLGVPVKPLESGFWSIYVEFKFYIFAAVIYFWKGRNWLIGALAGAFIAATFFKVAGEYAGGAAFLSLNNIFLNLSFEYFGWFAAGAAFYVYSRSGNYKWFLIAVSLAILSSAFVRAFQWHAFAAASLVSLFFAGSVVSPAIQRLLSSGVFQFFGFISYPLYLMQENMMIATVVRLGRANIGMPGYLYPLLPAALLSAAAYLVARRIEPGIREWLAGLAPNSRSKKGA